MLIAALATYVVEPQRWRHGLTTLLDLAILGVAICAPPAVSPLLAVGGLRALSVGVSWTAACALFAGALWAGAGWVRPRAQMAFTILVVLLGSALLLASLHLGLILIGHLAEPWWLTAAHGPGFLLAAVAPTWGSRPRAGSATRPARGRWCTATSPTCPPPGWSWSPSMWT